MSLQAGAIRLSGMRCSIRVLHCLHGTSVIRYTICVYILVSSSTIKTTYLYIIVTLWYDEMIVLKFCDEVIRLSVLPWWL